jgi:dipeptidyl aminopeptidase/acylaminoacyl peptidase
MKKILLYIGLSIGSLSGFRVCGQVQGKPVLDSNAIFQWPSLGVGKISPNGRYFAYFLQNDHLETTSLVIRSTGSDWERSFPGVRNGEFSGNSRYFIFISGDTLHVFGLDSKEDRQLAGVRSFSNPGNPRPLWVAYQMKAFKASLFLMDLRHDSIRRLDNVVSFSFSRPGNALALHTRSAAPGVTADSLIWLELKDGNRQAIWSNGGGQEGKDSLVNVVWDGQGSQLAFSVLQGGNKHECVIWYYANGMSNAEKRVTSRTKGIPDGFEVSSNYGLDFSENGRWLNIPFRKIMPKLGKPTGASVDVWSYKDTILQSVQLNNFKLSETTKGIMGERKFTGIIGVQGDSLVWMDEAQIKKGPSLPDDYILIESNLFGAAFDADPWWNDSAPRMNYLLSLRGGRPILLSDHSLRSVYITPDHQYLTYFDSRSGEYYSYNLKTKKRLSFSNIAPHVFYNEDVDKGDVYRNDFGCAGYDMSDSSLIVYDQYDLWKLDPSGRKVPMSITGGYGRLHFKEFRVVYDREPGYNPSLRVFKSGDTLVLSTFDPLTKENGFYTLVLDRGREPLKRMMAKEHIFRPQTAWGTIPLVNEFYPVRALDTNVWVVRRMSDHEAPNFYVSSDFRDYTPLTNMEPEKRYNWIRSELIRYPLPDGRMSEAVIYKPEDFDQTKKYPVIFTFYQRQADRLYDFPEPEYMEQELNIPYFVSRDYIVVTPDIHYTIGAPGNGALEGVASAAKRLMNFPWADAKRFGIQGHSFGGFEVNYIVTHSHLFEAAESGAGLTDLISDYNDLEGGEVTSWAVESYYEIGQGRIGKTLWNGPQLYLKNSPILEADKVTTPLLLMHNFKDTNSPWYQGLEFYLGLRRLRKKVWMLQYDNDGHVVNTLPDEIDYTIRVNQFFDHYLKGAPAPSWMVNGIPARLKGIENGYELIDSKE